MPPQQSPPGSTGWSGPPARHPQTVEAASRVGTLSATCTVARCWLLGTGPCLDTLQLLIGGGAFCGWLSLHCCAALQPMQSCGPSYKQRGPVHRQGLQGGTHVGIAERYASSILMSYCVLDATSNAMYHASKLPAEALRVAPTAMRPVLCSMDTMQLCVAIHSGSCCGICCTRGSSR
jgi:hypothetical protein